MGRVKIRLTESQYKRLLSEDNKSFLDGQVNFRNIGNKVDKFVAKCFEYIFKLSKNDSPYVRWQYYMGFFKKEFNLSIPEATLLAHNYIKFNDRTGDFKKFIGEPLEYFGKFTLEATIPVNAYVSGDIYGDYIGYATSTEEFYDKISEGDYDNYEPDWDSGIEYDCYDLNWEIDGSYASDRLYDYISGLPRDEVMDVIEIDN
jgi:hypothetical protein